MIVIVLLALLAGGVVGACMAAMTITRTRNHARRIRPEPDIDAAARRIRQFDPL